VTTVTVSDEVLLAQLRAGDTAVLEPLMERFSGRLFRVAQGITRSASDAEEVIQDVFLSLLNKAASFEGRAALGTWLYRITVNAALNKRRGKRAQLEVLIEDHLPTFKEDGHREGDRAFLLAD
jgi:RNA polymerase sigma-70 factor, ECF subfamily